MTPQQTLESLKLEFQHWRNNKAGLCIPNHLRRKAVELLATESLGSIGRALGLSGSQLKRWSNPSQSKPAASSIQPLIPPKPIEFVALSPPLNTQSPTNSSADVLLTFTQSNGNNWCLRGSLDATQMAAFIQATRGLPGDKQ